MTSDDAGENLIITTEIAEMLAELGCSSAPEEPITTAGFSVRDLNVVVSLT